MIRIIVLIAQILFALLVFQDAKERRMLHWLWAAFVFFMPILGIILYFVLRKPKSGGNEITRYR